MTSPVYKWYVLALLTGLYTVSFVDRTVLSLLAPAIKHDLGLSDKQLGMLGGLSFALTYTLTGIPLARWSERRSRVNLISAAVVAWSALTGLCGLAANFAQLFALRAGVGVGEAGCTPPAHSLISDLFSGAAKTLAISIYSMGIPIGLLVAALGVSWVAGEWGWRATFVVAAIPGVLLGLLIFFTVEEPARASEADGTVVPPLREVVETLFRLPTARNVVIGGTIVNFAMSGLATFTTLFFVRKFGLSVSQASATFALIFGAPQIFGMAIGGILTSNAIRRDKKWLALGPAIALVVGTPFVAAGLMQSTLWAALAMLVFGQFILVGYLAPQLATFHHAVGHRMRATAISILLLVHALIGMGLGPTLLGILSDAISSRAYGAGYTADCVIALKAHTGGLGPACRNASVEGLTIAMTCWALLPLWAAAHFFAASKTASRDLAY